MPSGAGGTVPKEQIRVFGGTATYTLAQNATVRVQFTHVTSMIRIKNRGLVVLRFARHLDGYAADAYVTLSPGQEYVSIEQLKEFRLRELNVAACLLEIDPTFSRIRSAEWPDPTEANGFEMTQTAPTIT